MNIFHSVILLLASLCLCARKCELSFHSLWNVLGYIVPGTLKYLQVMFELLGVLAILSSSFLVYPFVLLLDI